MRMLRAVAIGCLLAFFGCADDGGPQQTTCDYHGTIYEDGEIFSAGDGCNECKCNPDGNTPGEWSCTQIACADQ